MCGSQARTSSVAAASSPARTRRTRSAKVSFGSKAMPPLQVPGRRAGRPGTPPGRPETDRGPVGRSTGEEPQAASLEESTNLVEVGVVAVAVRAAAADTQQRAGLV